MQRPDISRPPVEGPETPQKPYPLRLRGPIVRGFQRGSRQLGFPTANIDPICLTSLNCDSSALDIKDGVYYGWVGLDFYSKPDLQSTDTTSSSDDNNKNEVVPDPLISAALPKSGQGRIFATALSVGMNPYFDGKQRTVELYILHDFTKAARQGGYKPVDLQSSTSTTAITQQELHSTDIQEGDIFQFYGARANLAILGYIRPQYDYTTQDDLIRDINTDVDVCKRSLTRPAYSTELLSDPDAPLLNWLIGFDWTEPVE